jgi:hypothetical protein
MLLVTVIDYTALRQVAPLSSDNPDPIGQTDEIEVWPGRATQRPSRSR